VILDLRLLRIRDFITRAGLCALSIAVASLSGTPAHAQNDFVFWCSTEFP